MARPAFLMHYVKHAEHGNKHVTDDELPGLLADGWVKWPRTREQKEARALLEVAVDKFEQAMDDHESVAPKRGRPRKAG